MTFNTDNARTFVATVRWQFAKTMSQWPHEYTVLKWRGDLEATFMDFVTMILRDGVVKPWPADVPRPRYHHTYLELDGWAYWTMEASAQDTTLVNRARVEQPGSA